MDAEPGPSLSNDTAQTLLDRPESLGEMEVRRLLVFLKRANEDLIGKLRMLRSEIGRVSRR